MKLISAPVFRLKGGGWYETDFKSDQEKKRNLAGDDKGEKGDGDKAEAKAETKADAKADGKADAKPAPAAKPAKAAAKKAARRPAAKKKPTRR